MANVTEGDPYYYAPPPVEDQGDDATWNIHCRRDHTTLQFPVATTHHQGHASLIVDALNHYVMTKESELGSQKSTN